MAPLYIVSEMLFTRLSFVFIYLLGLGHDKTARTRFVVDTGYAKYLGNNSFLNTVAYLGIPYAEPPLSERRFRAPLPLNTTRVFAEAGSQTVDARSYPDFCVQGSLLGPYSGGAGSEDCLKVNIYTPTSGTKLPVLFYIHGGGYVNGNPANWPFEHWIEQSPNVVIVSVYYRLTAFGFLATPEFRDGELGDLNAGFLDQMEALRWVKRHIHSFGGDPDQVTINGESAGGSSVELHLVANDGDEGLFSAAIPQSIYRARMMEPEGMEPIFDSFVGYAGCALGSKASAMACLRLAELSTLTRAQDMVLSTSFPWPQFVPVIDGTIFDKSPTVSLLEGAFAPVPIMVGATSNETVATSGDLVIVMKTMYPELTRQDLSQFEAHYPLSDFDSPSQRVRVATGESMFICGQTILGNVYSQRGIDAWAYRYNQPNPTRGDPSSGIVNHAAENWMMFRGINSGLNGTGSTSPMTPSQNKFSEELIAYWISFVRARNPNTYKLERSPYWSQYDAENTKRIVLQQAGSEVEIESGKEFDRCAFVASKAAHEEN